MMMTQPCAVGNRNAMAFLVGDHDAPAFAVGNHDALICVHDAQAFAQGIHDILAFAAGNHDLRACAGGNMTAPANACQLTLKFLGRDLKLRTHLSFRALLRSKCAM